MFFVIFIYYEIREEQSRFRNFPQILLLPLNAIGNINAFYKSHIVGRYLIYSEK